MTTVKGQGQFWDRVTEDAQPIVEALRLIQSVIPIDMIKGGDVLDAGCGVGDYGAAFTQLGAGSVAGIDISINSLVLAGQQTPSGDFLQASLTNLPYASSSFNVIWSWGVLHYVPDPQAALHEIARVLRPGGIAVIHTIKASFWASFERTSAKILRGSPDWLEEFILSTGERVIPLVSRIIMGRPPEAQTSKPIRHKLHERLFIPVTTHMFTLQDFVDGSGDSVTVTEAHPPISNLLNRDMSITIIMRKHS